MSSAEQDVLTLPGNHSRFFVGFNIDSALFFVCVTSYFPFLHFQICFILLIFKYILSILSVYLHVHVVLRCFLLAPCIWILTYLNCPIVDIFIFGNVGYPYSRGNILTALVHMYSIYDMNFTMNAYVLYL